MPEWLLKKDNYIPQKDKNTFITKSILSFLQVLIKCKPKGHQGSNVFGVSTFVKVLSAAVLILLVSFAKNLIFVSFIGVYILVIMSALDTEDVHYIIKVGLIPSIFTLMILLPSILKGNVQNSIMMIIKIFVSVSIANILSCTTEWNEITGTLKALCVPTIFIFVLDITMKYILILGDTSLNMLYALCIRSVGKDKNKSTALAAIIGTVFMKSKEMAEEMYGAMECRGFNGEYKLHKKFKFHMPDFICMASNMTMVLTYFLIGGLQ